MHNWLFLIVLFSVFSFISLFVPVSFLERSIFILINIGAIYYIIKQLKILIIIFSNSAFSGGPASFSFVLCFSIIFNIFGRASLSHTLSLTATAALTQVIALSVLLKIIIEIILLQIYRTRVQRGVTTIFDHKACRITSRHLLL